MPGLAEKKAKQAERSEDKKKEGMENELEKK